MEKRIEFKRSRKSFIEIYLFGVLLLLLYPFFSSLYESGSIINYLYLLGIILAFLYPEAVILYGDYIIERDRIIEITGYIAKKRTTIPVSSISHIVMRKSVIGRLMNYGDVISTSFTGLIIKMKGISNPDNIIKIIEEMMEESKEHEVKKIAR